MPAAPADYYTGQAAAALLGVSRFTLNEWVELERQAPMPWSSLPALLGALSQHGAQKLSSSGVDARLGHRFSCSRLLRRSATRG